MRLQIEWVVPQKIYWNEDSALQAGAKQQVLVECCFLLLIVWQPLAQNDI